MTDAQAAGLATMSGEHYYNNTTSLYPQSAIKALLAKHDREAKEPVAVSKMAEIGPHLKKARVQFRAYVSIRDPHVEGRDMIIVFGTRLVPVAADVVCFYVIEDGAFKLKRDAHTILAKSAEVMQSSGDAATHKLSKTMREALDTKKAKDDEDSEEEKEQEEKKEEKETAPEMEDLSSQTLLLPHGQLIPPHTVCSVCGKAPAPPTVLDICPCRVVAYCGDTCKAHATSGDPFHKPVCIWLHAKDEEEKKKIEDENKRFDAQDHDAHQAIANRIFRDNAHWGALATAQAQKQKEAEEDGWRMTLVNICIVCGGGEHVFEVCACRAIGWCSKRCKVKDLHLHALVCQWQNANDTEKKAMVAENMAYDRRDPRAWQPILERIHKEKAWFPDAVPRHTTLKAMWKERAKKRTEERLHVAKEGKGVADPAKL